MKIGIIETCSGAKLAAVYGDQWVSLPDALADLGREPVNELSLFIEKYADEVVWLNGEISQRIRSGKAKEYTYPLKDAKLLPPIPAVPKVFTARGNSALFTRVIRSAVCKQPVMEQRYNFNFVGHLSTEVVRPGFSATGWNYEMVAVVGKRCRNVSPEHMDDYIFGYTNMLDHSGGYKSPFEEGGPWFVPEKEQVFADAAYGYCYNGNTQVPTPIGPYIVTKDEVGDPHDQWTEERESGRLISCGNTKAVVFTIPEMISYMSGFMTLEPGDMFSTASISYDGYQSPADRYPPNAYIEAKTEKLGSLRLWIRDEREETEA